VISWANRLYLPVKYVWAVIREESTKLKSSKRRNGQPYD
jgi:hypothetical protein